MSAVRSVEAPLDRGRWTTVSNQVAGQLGRHAVRALYAEASLYPKPGLVSPVDSGSHTDMSMATFYRSLVALRAYFPAIARLGATSPDLAALQSLGRRAEQDMLRATAGVNTHRGAIFHLGLLCAAGGRLHRQGMRLSAGALCTTVAQRWGDAIRECALSAPGDPALSSHGVAVVRRYGVGGARGEAAAGFPTVLGVGLPAYRLALRATADPRRAGVHALFSLIARTDDSNLLWRGGVEGLDYAKRCAADYLVGGGALAVDWLARAQQIHRRFVERNLSPGGCADLLGITHFLHACDEQAGGFQ